MARRGAGARRAHGAQHRRAPVRLLCIAVPAALVLAVFDPAAAPAQTATSTGATDDGWGDDDSGWGDEGIDSSFDFGDLNVPTASLAAPESSDLRIGAFLRTDNALWVERFDDNPWAKSRMSLDLDMRYASGAVRLVFAGHLEYDLAYLHDRDSYDQPTLDAYEWDLQGRETFVAVGLGVLDLAFGRQIVAWGQGEAISPIDVVNPRDIREPGLADLEDIRMPVLMTRAGVFIDQSRFELILIHEADFGRRSPPLGPFSPLASVLDSPDAQAAGLTGALRSKTVRFTNDPGRFLSNEQQILFRWSYTATGVDLAAYAASILDQEGVLVLPDPMALFDPTVSRVAFSIEHPRYTLIGQSGAAVTGPLVFEWELAVALSRSLNVGSLDAVPPVVGIEKHNLLLLMLGVTYSGIDGLSLTLEFGKNVIVDGAPRLLGTFGALGRVQTGTLSDLTQAAEEPVFAFRALYTTLSQRLQLSAAATWFGWIGDFGWLVVGEALYQVIDPVSISVGFITYQPEIKNSPLEGLDDHDRLFLKARWDFTLL